MTLSSRLAGAAALALVVVISTSPSSTAQGRGPGAGGGGGPYGGGAGTGGPGGGGEEEGYGNNLAVPVVFAEGYGLLGLPTGEDPGLRPRPGEPNADVLEYWDPSAIFLKDGVPFYPQQTASHWQAAWRNGAAVPEQVVVNWSDNLTRQRWTARSVVRIETVLYQTPADTLTAYAMAYLYGKGTTEMWGAEATTYASTYRTVYSVCARLTIQKLVGPGGEVDERVPAFSSAVYQRFGQDGPGGYGAEVNVSGNLVYGYNWMLSQSTLPTDLKVGWWRLTFSIDPTATYTLLPEGGVATSYNVTGNTAFAGLDPGDLGDEVLFKPSLPNPVTSTVEIEIVARRTGRKPASPGRTK